MTLAEILELARKLGYDGIEARISANHKHGVELTASGESRAQFKDQSARSGIPVCCVATSCRYADPETRDQSIEESHQALDLASDVGARCIRVFGGAIPDGISRETAISGVSEALLGLADHAEEKGVTVCMETHDDWCDPAHVVEVVSRVNRPAIAVNWDIAHPVRRAGVSIDESYRLLKPWVRHAHFHDLVTDKEGKSSLVPIGQGTIDHRRAVELLVAGNYEGYMSGEWIGWEPFETHLPRELATMKGYQRESP